MSDTSRAPTLARRSSTITSSLSALTLLAATSSVSPPIATAQTLSQGACAAEKVVLGGCDPKDVATCTANCALFGSEYLIDKCCKHRGINANILAFEVSDTWIPRIEEYGKCTGANIRLQYVDGGEDEMSAALIQDVGENDDE
eukprot:CAMPEP_0196143002 /NCGR_PEP_ID=MMETSP0910-20130528/12563_1 /TAXON_ID=49265 /ORGANISM="Thalassiosira rotula, Strain GSO102" /LENGTH=142 /DNA_ID=CAMNT_0041404387 /DNA_START=33 /DNA_END=458 /DNA_ORIENTATION=+